VRDELGLYALDFGPTAPLSAQRLGYDLNDLDAVLLTHLHGDHIAGLPNLLIDFIFSTRRLRPLIIAGPPGTEERVRALCELLYPGVVATHLCFELRFFEWARRGELEVAGRRVVSYPAQHDERVEPCALRVEPLQAGGAVIAFSGDTGWCASLSEVSVGADALVCECSYARYVFDGHLSLEELLAHRAELFTPRLILTHLGVEARDEVTSLLQSDHPSRAGFELADDGLEFVISPAHTKFKRAPF
jgi:ribonuclease BN (tRNA processing enzyme)